MISIIDDSNTFLLLFYKYILKGGETVGEKEKKIPGNLQCLHFDSEGDNKGRGKKGV